MAKTFSEKLTTKEGLQEIAEWEKYLHDEITTNNSTNGRDLNANGIDDQLEKKTFKGEKEKAQKKYDEAKRNEIEKNLDQQLER